VSWTGDRTVTPQTESRDPAAPGPGPHRARHSESDRLQAAPAARDPGRPTAGARLGQDSAVILIPWHSPPAAARPPGCFHSAATALGPAVKAGLTPLSHDTVPCHSAHPSVISTRIESIPAISGAFAKAHESFLQVNTPTCKSTRACSVRPMQPKKLRKSLETFIGSNHYSFGYFNGCRQYFGRVRRCPRLSATEKNKTEPCLLPREMPGPEGCIGEFPSSIWTNRFLVG
jgi:hypothetical protein